MFTPAARFVCLVALSFALAFAARAPRVQAEDSIAPVGSLESLLKQTDFMFKKAENGMYRIAVERTDGVTIVMADEATMTWKDKNGNDVRRIMIYRWISDTPEGFVADRALLEKVMEYNVKFNVGRINQNKNGFFFTTGLWARTADVENLTDEINLAINTVAEVSGTLQPLIDQSSPAKVAQVEDGQ